MVEASGSTNITSLNGLAPTWLDAGFKRNSRALPAAATTDHPPVITPLSSPI